MGVKKIKSKTIKYNGITFKSELEKNTYVTLINAGIKPEYEKRSYKIFDGFNPTVPFYDSRTKKRGEKKGTHRPLELKHKKVNDITYKPDFEFDYNGKTVIIESKGHENESFPLRKKLFRKYLEENNKDAMYFEVHSIKHVNQLIEILNEQK